MTAPHPSRRAVTQIRLLMALAVPARRLRVRRLRRRIGRDRRAGVRRCRCAGGTHQHCRRMVAHARLLMPKSGHELCLLGHLRCDLSREIDSGRVGLVRREFQHRNLDGIDSVAGSELDLATAHQTHAIGSGR